MSCADAAVLVSIKSFQLGRRGEDLFTSER